jgi:hypothetical protein
MLKIATFKNLFYGLMYVLSFIFIYEKYLFFYFEYFGFLMNRSTNIEILFSVLFSIIPIYYHKGFTSISSAISSFIYILIYVPTIIVFYFNSSNDVFLIQLLFCFCMIFLFLSDRFNVKTISFKNVINSNHIFILTSTVTIYVIYIYRSNLQFLSFYDIYELRSDNDNLLVGSFDIYIFSWLKNVLIPICFAYGIYYKKRMGLFIGLISCIVIYMAIGSKASLLLPVIYLGIYFTLRKNVINWLRTSLKYLAISIFVISFFNFGMLPSIVLARTIGNGGLLNFWYYDYFLNNPYTYWSHINLINYFTDSYPYEGFQLGQVVGMEYWSLEMNANANFWATDGFAAFGIYGVIIITFLVFLFLIFLNGITKKHNLNFVLICYIPFVLSLTNASLFTSLLTGGGILLCIFFLFNQQEIQTK